MIASRNVASEYVCARPNIIGQYAWGFRDVKIEPLATYLAIPNPPFDKWNHLCEENGLLVDESYG